MGLPYAAPTALGGFVLWPQRARAGLTSGAPTGFSIFSRDILASRKPRPYNRVERSKEKKKASKDAPLQERKAGKMPALRKKASGD
jgi:hypothetical protein